MTPWQVFLDIFLYGLAISGAICALVVVLVAAVVVIAGITEAFSKQKAGH